MSQLFATDDHVARRRGLDAASGAIQRNELVVLPTDTVYGVAADAFSPTAVGTLLDAKERGRDMPVPVLVANPRVIDGLAFGVSPAARDLVAAFWPGALTVICLSQPSLQWDLGRTDGTVALRMPLHPVALELLAITGPLAVSSANLSGMPPATTAEEALTQLGTSVAVYLDAGACADATPSTIVDASGERPRVVRLGALSLEVLRQVVPDL